MRNSSAVERLGAGLIGFLAIVLLDGCHRRMIVTTLPAIIQAPYIAPSPPPHPGMEGWLPDAVLIAPPLPKVTEIRPRRPLRRGTSRGAASESAAAADAANTDAAVDISPLGELSAGGNTTPQTQQDAFELISSSERRLSRLSSTVARQQQAQLRKVRYFLKQAKQALSTGDAEGAKTLATKAKLLLDDVIK